MIKLQQVQPLQKSSTAKLSQKDYERLYNLYQEKKSRVTLDGKQAKISRLSSKFPIVFMASTENEVEFAAVTIERILNNTCAFKSQ